jgi:hypothetical protein
VLVAGPMFRVKDRSAQLAKTIQQEIAKHVDAAGHGHA